jgi:hypothetical protein
MPAGKPVLVLSSGYRTAAPIILTLEMESSGKENTYVKSDAM